jgi:hypothetical protein
MDRLQCGVAVNFDVEGRIGDNHMGRFATEQALVIITTKGVSAHWVVTAELPAVTQFADRRSAQRKGRLLGGRASVLVSTRSSP